MSGYGAVEYSVCQTANPDAGSVPSTFVARQSIDLQLATFVLQGLVSLAGQHISAKAQDISIDGGKSYAAAHEFNSAITHYPNGVMADLSAFLIDDGMHTMSDSGPTLLVNSFSRTSLPINPAHINIIATGVSKPVDEMRAGAQTFLGHFDTTMSLLNAGLFAAKNLGFLGYDKTMTDLVSLLGGQARLLSGDTGILNILDIISSKKPLLFFQSRSIEALGAEREVLHPACWIPNKDIIKPTSGSAIAALAGNVQFKAEAELSVENSVITASFKQPEPFNGRTLTYNGRTLQEQQMGTYDHQCGFFSVDTNRVDAVTQLLENLDKPYVRRSIAEEMRNKLLSTATDGEHDQLPEAIKEAAAPLTNRIHALDRLSQAEQALYAPPLKEELLQWCSEDSIIRSYLHDYIGAPRRMIEINEQIEDGVDGAPSTMATLAAFKGYALKVYTKNDDETLKCIYQYNPTQHGFMGPFQERHVIFTSLNPNNPDAKNNHYNVLLAPDQMTAHLKKEAEKGTGGVTLSGGTVMIKDVNITADNIIQIFGQQFVAVLGGIHKAREFFAKSVGPVHIGESFDRREVHIDTKKHKEHTIDIKSLPASIIANYAHFESLGGADITFVGTHIKGPSEVVTGGRVHFKLGTNTYYSYRFDDDSDAMWTDKRTSVQQDTTFSECQFTHPMHIKNASKVIIEKIDKRP
ncbi:MAG: hypothetical protein Q8R43_00730, partial [Alphaproteobacteria bacterium]|nr:hypothetical protein [Alphaproteobacteria bacterium]